MIEEGQNTGNILALVMRLIKREPYWLLDEAYEYEFPRKIGDYIDLGYSSKLKIL